MEWWGYVIIAGSIISSGLAWAAKLWWSKEFAAAKDETIKSKDAQIAMLEREINSIKDSREDMVKSKDAHIGVMEREIGIYRSFSSEKLKELYISTKTQLEEQIGEDQKRIQELQLQKDILFNKGNKLIDIVAFLDSEKSRLDEHVSFLEYELQRLREAETLPPQIGGPTPEALVIIGNVLRKEALRVSEQMRAAREH
jgi:hypothetical protein